ncbi:13200_t:CDS:1, partial [Gigaspora rosea]
KQKAESKAEIEKLKTEFESKMSQQSKKSRPPVPPKDHEFYADQGDPRWSNVSREEALQWFDKAFPLPIASKPERLRSSNQNTRINRIESKVDEIGQMTSQFGRMMLDNKKPVAKSNSTYRYFPPLIPSQSQYASPDSDDNEDEEGGYNEEENKWHAPQSEKKQVLPVDNKSHINAQSALSMKDIIPKTYDQLMNSLSPAMQRICKSNQSHKVQEETNEWFSSIQYLHSNINDLTISN